ncbi:hypothetical protein WJU23_05665 [Prosthecobacter sp. SYSU 5D2]|uniref:hypothetical protein n=1 Tax=Prosthecobacter sp. SYSU 5D2 TaxID=3134134 RepID=UPI0031FF14FE
MNRNRSTWLFITMLGFSALQAQEAGPDQVELRKLQQEDLRALAKQVARYEIYGATPKEAISQLWKQVLGRESALHIRIPWDPAKALVISMDVKDCPVSEILNYIAGLSACDWSVRGWDESGLMLEFTRSEGIDDTGMMLYAEAFVLNEQGLATLGVSKDAAAQDLIPALEYYSIHFDEEKRGYARYHGQDQTLSVCVIKDQLPMVKAVVLLANAGKLRPYQRP